MNTEETKKKPSWRLRYVNGAARSQNTRAEQEEATFQLFITNIVRPAFSEIAQRLAETGRTVNLQETRAACSLVVYDGTSEEMGFRITPLSLPTTVIPAIEIRMRERKGLRIHRKSVRLTNTDGQTITLTETIQTDIVTCFFHHYESALKNRT